MRRSAPTVWQWFRWILPALLLFAQWHVCASQYVLSSGDICRECLILDDTSSNATEEAHGDCHDCCVIDTCEADEDVVKTTPPNFLFAEWRPLQPEVPLLEPLTPRIAVSVVSRFATGPPRSRSSRAPPFFHFA